MRTTASIIFIVSIFHLSLCAQKVEVEKRVSSDEFPNAAKAFLGEKYPALKHARYYFETGSEGVNFEAKFKWQGHCYSVEFFESGQWKDAEKQVAYNTLPLRERQVMEAQFKKDFKKWKVKRVQEQSLPGRTALRFEMEVKGKDNSGWAMYEYLFEADGSMVQRQKIILPSNNITLY